MTYSHTLEAWRDAREMERWSIIDCSEEEEETPNTAISAAQKKLAEMREQGIKPIILNPRDKAKANPNSLKLAIRAMCWECVGGEHSENARQLVRECAVGEKCPLFNHRPWKV